MLSQVEVEFFNAQGYLVIEGVCSPERVATLKSLAEEERARARSSPDVNDVLETSSHSAQREVFRLSLVMARHPEFQSVAWMTTFDAPPTRTSNCARPGSTAGGRITTRMG